MESDRASEERREWGVEGNGGKNSSGTAHGAARGWLASVHDSLTVETKPQSNEEREEDEGGRNQERERERERVEYKGRELKHSGEGERVEGKNERKERVNCRTTFSR